MNSFRKMRLLTMSIGLAWMVMWAPGQAAILTFDGNICSGGQSCGDSSPIDQSYGDIAGQVDVIYRNIAPFPGDPGLLFWATDYNDLVNVAWTSGNDSSSIAEIFLSPTPGNKVTLNSFDLGAFSNTQRDSQYTILDGAMNELFSSGTIPIGIQPGNLHNTFTPNLTSHDGIRIQWGPSAFNVGIDNVDFTVMPAAVPVPSAMLLFGTGIAGLVGWRWRQSKNPQA